MHTSSSTTAPGGSPPRRAWSGGTLTASTTWERRRFGRLLNSGAWHDGVEKALFAGSRGLPTNRPWNSPVRVVAGGGRGPSVLRLPVASRSALPKTFTNTSLALAPLPLEVQPLPIAHVTICPWNTALRATDPEPSWTPPRPPLRNHRLPAGPGRRRPRVSAPRKQGHDVLRGEPHLPSPSRKRVPVLDAHGSDNSRDAPTPRQDRAPASQTERAPFRSGARRPPARCCGPGALPVSMSSGASRISACPRAM
jgi:hypothetical protein